MFTVPVRLRHFTGRQDLLDQLHSQLTTGDGRIAVTALHGLGGVGKTQLAIEYAHRHAAAYRLVWWVNAEQATLVAEQLAGLATHLGLRPTGQVVVDASAVLDGLRQRDGWLIVFDNAENPVALKPWLPNGPGHVIITSRGPGWVTVADRLEVDVLPRHEAVAFLSRRIPAIDAATADALAGELGELPLALEQAAAYLDTTGLLPPDYLAKFRGRRTMLGKGADLTRGASIATVWSLALDRLSTHAPAAVALLDLAAWLGPEPIPLALFTEHPDLLDEPLRTIAGGQDPDADLDDVLAALLGYSLARRAGDTITVHRLVAAAVRAGHDSDKADQTAAIVRALLGAYQPGDTQDPACWPRWATLAPHVLTAPATQLEDQADTLSPDFRQLLLKTAYYLDARGDFHAAAILGRSLHTRWSVTLGPDDPHSLAAAFTVASAHRRVGAYQAARQLDEDTLARYRRVLSDDHPGTLSSANNLAIDLRNLGEHQAARRLAEDTLARYRRGLGDDHPDTLRSANNLAIDLRQLGEHQAARNLDEDTLARYRRVLGDDHPSTLNSANNLAVDLRNLGRYQAARRLTEDTFARYRRILGADHTNTLRSANNLAIDLRNLGEHQAARRLDEDTLARRRRIRGDDHPDTLTSASNLAEDLRRLGEVAEAETLEDEVRRRRER